jgi:hypothetical protein
MENADIKMGTRVSFARAFPISALSLISYATVMVVNLYYTNQHLIP